MYKYCGPYWSDGKLQQSVRGQHTPENSLDECCFHHDAHYFDARAGENVNLDQVDGKFIECAMQQGVTGNLMAGAVAISRKLRGKPSSPADDLTMKKNLRVAAKAKKPTKSKSEGSSIGALQLSAPSAISTVFTSVRTKTKNIPDGISVSGKEFIGMVEGNGVATFGLGKSAMLSPAYFYGGVLGQLARSYTKYRFTSLIVHYIPRVPTSMPGQVVLCSQENITMPALSAESSTFLQRALVSGNGVMCPIWTPCRMKIQTDNRLRYIDAFTTTDINENIFCDVQCYTNVGTSGQAGTLWLEYECELKVNKLEPHQTNLPISTGPATRVTLTDKSTLPNAGDPVVLNDSAGIASAWANGTVLKAVIDIQGSSPGSGTSLSSAWKVATKALTTAAGATTPVYSSDVIVGGMTLYLEVSGSDLYAYTSLEAATAGNITGQLYYNFTASGKATWIADVTVVRLGPDQLDNIQ